MVADVAKAGEWRTEPDTRACGSLNGLLELEEEEEGRKEGKKERTRR